MNAYMTMRVACLSIVEPSKTGAGGPIVFFSVGEVFAQNGCQVIYITVGSQTTQNNDSKMIVHYVNKDNFVSDMKEIFSSFRPNFVWIFHLDTWKFFDSFKNDYPHLLYTIDTPWEILRLREEWRKQANNPLRRIARYIQYHVRLRQSYQLEADVYKSVSKNGWLVAAKRNDQERMSKVAKSQVLWAPLPYYDSGQVNRKLPQQPIALMLGRLGGSHTRIGLKYFFDNIWPKWITNPPNSVCRIVGSGILPATFAKPAAHPTLQWMGFVPDLENEWDSAAMMLVPVNTPFGIRSRILESWMRGVPVISHPSAEIGIPELKDRHNYLAATTGDEWLDAVRLLENDQSFAQELIQNGRRTYEDVFSPLACQKHYLDLAHQAINRFTLTSQKSGF